MRTRARTGDLTILAAGFTMMATLTILTFLVAPHDDAPRHRGSSYAPNPDGAKAAYVFLRETGHDVQRSFDPVATLDADPARTTLLLADPLHPPSAQDRAALVAFVEAGGTVLAAGSSAIAFLPGLTQAGAIPGDRQAPRNYVPGFPSPLARHVEAVEMTPAPRRIRTSEHGWMPVFTDGDAPGVLTARLGAGRVIWWASSRPLSNAAIAAPGHLELLLNAIGPPADRRVLWDEHYHGYTRSLWSYAANTPVAWGLTQLGLLGALALFTFGRRHGPVRSRVVEPRASPLEFIDTMGALYERARTAGAAVATARSRLRRLLRARTGLPSSSSDERFVAALEGRAGIDGAEARRLLERSAAAARDPEIDERKALALVAELQNLAARISSARQVPAGEDL